MVRIDPGTNEVVAQVHDQYLPIYFGTEPLGRVFIVDGTLWQETPINLVRRDVGTGEASATIPKPPDTWTTLSGFGSLWFVAGNYLTLDDVLYRVDPLSGRTIEVIETDAGGAFRDIAIGRNGIFALTSESEILTIDPAVNDVVDRDALALESTPDGIVSVGGSVWVCECADGRITQWDPVTDEAIETVTFAQQGFILGDPREASLGSVTDDDDDVWLMDREAGTLTAVDPATSTAGQPIGIPQWAGEHDFGADSIWIAADDEVYRIHLDDFRAESIALPDGVVAGGIAVDAVTGSVWVGNFVSGR
jgi:streptogramin lyase